MLLCVIALAACKVDATVTVRLHTDGSGAVSVRVVLDRRAVRAAEIGGGALEDRVRLVDLPAAGWMVSPWRRHPGGGATIVVRKPFSRPHQVAGIVAELNGASGPLRGFKATRASSTFSTGWTVRGTVDLRRVDTGLAADPELVASLTAERVDIPAVEQRITGGVRNGLRIRAVAELPGGQRTSIVAMPDGRAVLAARADETDADRMLLLGAGIGLGVLALAILIVGERRGRRARRTRRERTLSA